MKSDAVAGRGEDALRLHPDGPLAGSRQRASV